MSPQPQAAVGRAAVPGGRAAEGHRARRGTPPSTTSTGSVHAVIVDGSIGRGRITGVDTRAAEAQPGRAAGDQPPQRARSCRTATTPGRTTRPARGCASSRTTGSSSTASRSPSWWPPPWRPRSTPRAWSRSRYDAEQPSTDLTERPAGRADRPTRAATPKPALRSAAVRLDLTYRTGAQPPQPDGAARHHRPLGRRQAHRVGQDPVGGGHPDRARRRVRPARWTRCGSSRRSSAAPSARLFGGHGGH